MVDTSNICLSCGICCDGTLIGFVQLEDADLPAARELLDIEEVGSNAVFLQPCKKYCGGCTIYLDRPKACRKFKCKLLKSVENKKVAFEKALEIVGEAKRSRKDLEIHLSQRSTRLRSKSFYFKMVELKKVLASDSGELLEADRLALSAELTEMDKMVEEHFGVTL
jgi:Fe-S-cluster containining protein